MTDGAKPTTVGDGFLERPIKIRLDAYLELLETSELMDIMVELGVQHTELYQKA